MKILVLGASGGTGKAVVRQALERGWQVTVVVRHPSAFILQDPNLRIVEGDVFNISSFSKEVFDKDAVISCLGTGAVLKPTKVYSVGIKNILQAMSEANVKRIICISAGGVEATRQMGLFIRVLTRFLLQRILKNLYVDMLLMEKLLKESTVNYTIMRPARLTDQPATGNYRTAMNSNLTKPWTISKADLAGFMLNAIDDAANDKSIVEIAY